MVLSSCISFESIKPIKNFIKNEISRILFLKSYFGSLIDLIKALNVLTWRHHVVFRESRIVNIPPLRRLQSPQVENIRKYYFLIHKFIVSCDVSHTSVSCFVIHTSVSCDVIHTSVFCVVIHTSVSCVVIHTSISCVVIQCFLCCYSYVHF